MKLLSLVSIVTTINFIQVSINQISLCVQQDNKIFNNIPCQQQDNNIFFNEVKMEYAKMLPAIFKDDISDYKNWTIMRKAIVNELIEIIEKINQEYLVSHLSIEDYAFRGFKLEPVIQGFFRKFDVMDVIIEYKFFKNIIKHQVIKGMKEKLDDKFIIETKESLANINRIKIASWRLQIFHWLGNNVAIISESTTSTLVPITKARLQFVKLQTVSENEAYAIFNYFKDQEPIKVKINIIESIRTPREDPEGVKIDEESLERIGDEGQRLSWTTTYWKWLAGGLSLAGMALLAYYLWKTSKLWGIISTISETVPLLSFGNATELLEGVADITTVESNKLLDFLRRIFSDFLSKMKQSTVSKNSAPRFLSENEDIFGDLKINFDDWNHEYDDILLNLKVEDITHNLNYLEWGIFDVTRYGIIKVKNTDLSFKLHLFNSKINNQSFSLITKFFSNIRSKLEGAYINQELLDSSNQKFQIFQIISQILQKELMIIDNKTYKFSMDSFWISSYKIIDDRIYVVLNHDLLKEGLEITMQTFLN
ncbi:hypothetical protein [Spiroplasma endosymbiont of Dilophus febrilis]|uniref:hypothetical protein n=1 Tax=Spiroplasma endosymbiont of Dilophus febrilis TaxID=3066292 RepID=UPI00313DB470